MYVELPFANGRVYDMSKSCEDIGLWFLRHSLQNLLRLAGSKLAYAAVVFVQCLLFRAAAGGDREVLVRSLALFQSEIWNCDFWKADVTAMCTFRITVERLRQDVLIEKLSGRSAISSVLLLYHSYCNVHTCEGVAIVVWVGEIVAILLQNSHITCSLL